MWHDKGHFAGWMWHDKGHLVGWMRHNECNLCFLVIAGQEGSDAG